MPRWYIIRTLIRKETLRYRYNWGLLIVVIALLALSGLVAISSRYKSLPGVGTSEIKSCDIIYPPHAHSRKWIEHLKANPPDFACKLTFHEQSWAGTSETTTLEPGQMIIELTPADVNRTAPGDDWRIRYWHMDDSSAPGVMRVRDWFMRRSNDIVQSSPRITEETRRAKTTNGSETIERLPLVVASLAIFAMYLLSFNLFITSTGEEREKRVMLGLLLSPASPTEVIIAKALFYGCSSLAVAMAVVGMYNPRLLLLPALWLTAMCGSVCYVAIGTVVISLVRRQTTINTVSMLYLITTSIVMILAQFLLPFQLLQLCLVENYLYGQMKMLVGAEPQKFMMHTQILLAGMTGAWCVAALWIFERKATSIARAR
jgi:ABC-2 family transporter protein